MSKIEFPVSPLKGRYLPPDQIQQWIQQHPSNHWNVLGNSFEGRPIHAYQWGMGAKKILMWSQMHGNESTTTRALSDLIHYLNTLDSHHPWYTLFRFCLIPQLNPDGALRYTRVNARNIDLNRDAQALQEAESRVLRSCFDEFEPDYCFNLHDQRSIFGVGDSGQPAQVSFLAPAADKGKTQTLARCKAAFLIVQMQKELSLHIDNRVGRYDDAFNAHCVGDTFQALGVPTILFEAGHAGLDYQREECRALIRKALEVVLHTLQDPLVETITIWPKEYNAIPENKKNFCDVRIEEEGAETIHLQFREELDKGVLHFIPGQLKSTESIRFAHQVLKRGNAEDDVQIDELLQQR